MEKISLVIFDVDGVLLDSLKSHLQICKDKNKEYNLGLTIPSVDEFRQMVNNGVKISPMEYFFKAVGFPSEYANKATTQYNEVFMRDYVPKPFSGVNHMLSRLVQAGLKLGIVTANVRANVDTALGNSMRFFVKEAILTKDEIDGESKIDALLSVTKKLHVDVKNVIYVGDQPSDYFAAEGAGVNFLGVTYGWGFLEKNEKFSTINSVEEIANFIIKEENMVSDNNVKLQYAWEWFKYHAQQRLIAFHYFLIIVGIIGVAYSSNSVPPLFKRALCVVGAIISVAFFLLDVRNNNLVEIGKKELECLGHRMASIDNINKKNKGAFWISHKCWLRVIYITMFIVFVVFLFIG